MSIYDIIFYLFALITIGSGIFVVTTRNIVHSAFFLLFTFFGVAGIYVLLAADFVAIVQLIVYVGGILILLLFGVMLTSRITSVQVRTGAFQILPATVTTAVLAGILISTVTGTAWRNVDAPVPPATTYNLGLLLVNEYAVVFELLGMVLLIALIGAASMARREP